MGGVTGDLGTTNVWLAIMAIVSLLEALVLIGVLLGRLVHPAFYGLSAFVGGGLLFAGVTDWCGMGMLLAKMPWNNPKSSCADGSGAACSR